MDTVAVDVGGTHARFALAQIGGGSILLGPETVLKTSDYPGLGEAWRAFAAGAGQPLPPAAAIAIAAPLGGESVRMTNNSWTLRPADLAAELGVERLRLVNDFEAVGYAVAACEAELRHVCGPDLPLPKEGVVTVVGPGTGLGVAILHRSASGDQVIATEGGHIGFAPVDSVDERILARLRERFGRVSVERVVCGAGLAEIHAAMTGASEALDDRSVWQLALAGTDRAAAKALDRFCRILGDVAGDLALAQGAGAVVIAGGLGLRLADRLPQSAFADGFCAKGRYTALMEALPVKLITYPQPGLLGAAAAFAALYAG